MMESRDKTEDTPPYISVQVWAKFTRQLQERTARSSRYESIPTGIPGGSKKI